MRTQFNLCSNHSAITVLRMQRCSDHSVGWPKLTQEVTCGCAHISLHSIQPNQVYQQRNSISLTHLIASAICFCFIPVLFVFLRQLALWVWSTKVWINEDLHWNVNSISSMIKTCFTPTYKAVFKSLWPKPYHSQSHVLIIVHREQQRRPVPEGDREGRAYGGGPTSHRTSPTCLSPAGLQHFRGEWEERANGQPAWDVGPPPERPLLSGHISQNGLRTPVQIVRYVPSRATHISVLRDTLSGTHCSLNNSTHTHQLVPFSRWHLSVNLGLFVILDNKTYMFPFPSSCGSVVKSRIYDM